MELLRLTVAKILRVTDFGNTFKKATPYYIMGNGINAILERGIHYWFEGQVNYAILCIYGLGISL